MSKNLDETVCLQSDEKEWIRQIRKERLQRIAEGTNECPGTHCSLIEQEERENSSCQRLT